MWICFQSEKAKRAGNTPTTITVADYIAKMKFSSDDALWEPLVLEEESHVNARAATLAVSEMPCLSTEPEVVRNLES